MNKCVFLDRDGVINKEIGDHVYTLDKFEIIEDVPQSIQILKDLSFKIIVVTNQSGIIRGKYSRNDMNACHEVMMRSTYFLIDHIYYSPYHESVTRSLTRKPDSLMFEKAIARYGINPETSWMVGDKERDLVPAKKLGIQTIMVGDQKSKYADRYFKNLPHAVRDGIFN
jgi:D-glycero-D-manno-heptose 1,7-bisphosphate phosphatase